MTMLPKRCLISIYLFNWWVKVVDVKHRTIVTQTLFLEIPVEPCPLVFYYVVLILSPLYAIMKQTPVIVFHTKFLLRN